MAPFCITVFRLVIMLVAGATLATSIFGVLVHSLLPLPDGGSAAPDWVLGWPLGLGGIFGRYLGAAFQPRVPQHRLRLGLGLLLAVLGAGYACAAPAAAQPS